MNLLKRVHDTMFGSSNETEGEPSEPLEIEIGPTDSGDGSVELRALNGPFAGNRVRVMNFSDRGAYYNLGEK